MNVENISEIEAANFCNKINLNTFSDIQSYGALLVLDDNLHIIQYSENIAHLLETPVNKLLGTSLSAQLTSEINIDHIDDWVACNQYKRMNWIASDKEIPIWIRTCRAPEGIIVEIERYDEKTEDYNSFFELTQHVTSSIRHTNTSINTETLFQITCDLIQEITGFDRVLVYQFDQSDQSDQSGIVVGETQHNKLESYMGLHFPATDIPKNVRDMYLKYPLRYLPDIHTQPVKISPEISPITNSTLNLSSTNIRMIAPIHVEYLTNMGLEAATSIAIIRDDKLWGLIACHHQTPKFLPVNVRLILMLIANTLARQISALEFAKYFHAEERDVEIQASLTMSVSKEDSLTDALDHHHDQMLEIVSATGMSMYYQKELLHYGVTPNDKQVLDLVSWLNTRKLLSTHTYTSLPEQYPASSEFKSTACGLLAVPITRLEDHYLLFYRPELTQSITWAGNPEDVLKCRGSSYSPRDSFERFKATIVDHSIPWTLNDIKSADFIRSIVVNRQLQDLLQVQAMHDPLTGLLNRLYLNQRLTMEINRADREHHPIAVILIDLDFFKKINDNFGHQAGDLVLSEFAKFLTLSFRGYDYIYRYGGEEFLILLPAINKLTTQQKAEVLRRDIKKLILEFNGKTLPTLTISAGIAMYPENGIDARSLIAAADNNLYKAKSSGRDKIVADALNQ